MSTKPVSNTGRIALLVLGGVVAGIEAAGLVPLVHRDLPMNDGAVSYGQTVVAWARHDAV